MPPPLTAHIQVRGARHIWTTAGAQRTLGCTMGNGEQPGLQQESLKEKKTLRKKKKKKNPGLSGPATRGPVVLQRAEFARENLE